MKGFTYKGGELFVDDVPVRSLAERYGTPLYLYSQTNLREQFDRLAKAMVAVKPRICFSMKANSNAAVIRTFLERGAGVDVVTAGELYRALRAGAEPSAIVFAGVGKTVEEIEYALKKGIHFFTVESEPEAQRISDCARRLKRKGRIAFRVNPDVDPKTHKYISTGKKESKFGLDINRAEQAYRWAAGLPGIELAGLHVHIGSQILNSEPFGQALEKIEPLCAKLKAAYPSFKVIDIGGGIGIQYKPGQKPLAPEVYAKQVLPVLKRMGLDVFLEPGRYLVGNAGIVVGRVQYIKDNVFRKFVVTDIGMNDLIRPTLYEAHHEILAVRPRRGVMHADVVGPVCESGDYVAQDRDVPVFQQDDLIAVSSAGAYGFAMASEYNSRPLVAEVMVSGKKASLIRKRETWKDLVRSEVLPR